MGMGYCRLQGGIAVDATGKSYVGDSDLEKLFFFDASGDYILDHDMVGGAKYVEEKAGVVYAVPTASTNIVKYQTTGTYIETLGTYRVYGLAIRDDGKLVVGMNTRDFQTAVVVNADGTDFFYFPNLSSVATIEVDDEDSVMIGDLSNDTGRVQKFSSAGDSMIGIPPLPEVAFDLPNGIAVSSNGSVYVSNTNTGKITVFDQTGVLSGSFAATGSGNGEHQTPLGVVIDNTDTIYVADSVNNRIQVFNSQGVYQRQWPTELNSTPTEPTHITIANSKAYVIGSQSGDPVIQVFDLLGTPLFTFGSYGNADGQFNTVSGITHDSQGLIYISDSVLNRIQIFSATGTYVSTITTYGEPANTFSGISALAMDAHDNLYILENNMRIIILNNAGTLVTTFGENGSNPGQFSDVKTIAVTSNKIFITDYGKSSVEVFSYTDDTVYTDSPVTPPVVVGRSNPLPLLVLQALSDAMRGNTVPPKDKLCSPSADRFIQNLKRGMRTTAVSKVQQFLFMQNMYSGPITSYFGPLTESAVKRFQSLYKKDILEPLGLQSPTGWWYPATRTKANTILGC